MLDRVGPTLTGICRDIEFVKMQEIVDCAHHPAAEMMKDAIGFGKQPEQVLNDPVFGPYWVAFFTEALESIAQGLSVELDEIQTSMEVATAIEAIDVAIGHIPAGAVVGVKHLVNGIVGGQPFIRTEHVWCLQKGVNGWPAPDDRYRYVIEIEGRPSMRAVIDPLQSLTPGGEVYDAALVGTMGAAINAIADVCAADPGILHPMAFAPWRPQKHKAGATV